VFTFTRFIGALLLGAAAAAVAAPPRSFSDFTPSGHGFAFVNHFTGSSLPGPLVLLHKAVNAPDEFGLCGGMCFAAADFFLAGRDIPAQANAPKRGQPLYDYIYQRQIDSFGPRLSFAAKFSRWMDLPDDGLFAAGSATLGELDAMLDALAQLQPVHIGLVYINSEKTRIPWNNHQVLATGATLAPESAEGITECSLRVYDPNYPGNDHARIDIRLTCEGFDRLGHDRVPIIGSVCTLVIPRTDGRADRTRNVRGMFAMPYEPRTPPETLK